MSEPNVPPNVPPPKPTTPPATSASPTPPVVHASQPVVPQPPAHHTDPVRPAVPPHTSGFVTAMTPGKMAEPKKDSALEEQLAPQFRTGFAPGPKKATKAGPVAANVTLTDWVFIPHEVTVPVGSSVEWELKVGPHSIVADDDSFNSGLLHAPAKFTHTFETKGRHQYYCELHGSRNNQGMHGVVNVI